MTQAPDGALVVFKPAGLTSHDIVDKVRRIYGGRAGHAGTLDPMAIGVLVIFLERSLKLLQYIPASALDKTYLARVTLGRTTDTYDATGETTAQHQQPILLEKERILDGLRHFVGEYKQRPPNFSAVKVKGKRAYDLARRGESPDLPARMVHVSSIRLIREFGSETERHLVLRIHCSRGTYIRSIAHELGQFFGCGGHLSYLLRERVGVWAMKDAFPFWKVEQHVSFSSVPGFMPLREILPYPRVVVQNGAEAKIRNGVPLDPRDIKLLNPENLDSPSDCEERLIQVLSPQGDLLALYKPELPRPIHGAPRLVPVRILSERCD